MGGLTLSDFPLSGVAVLGHLISSMTENGRFMYSVTGNGHFMYFVRFFFLGSKGGREFQAGESVSDFCYSSFARS